MGRVRLKNSVNSVNSFGFSPNGRMPKSDVVLMAVLDDGDGKQRPYIVDSWAEGHRMPTPDQKLAEVRCSIFQTHT
jgi:hypothetical protein